MDENDPIIKEEPQLDEKEQRKIRLHQRLKWVLIVLNLLLLVELLYGIINIIYRQIKDANSCTIVNELNKSEYTESIPINDYVIYGESLSLYRYDYDYQNPDDYFLKGNSKFILKDACQNKSYEFTPSAFLNENINLSLLPKGSYYVYYNDGERETILSSYSYDSSNNYSFYTLPYKKQRSDKNYTRKKVSIIFEQSHAFPIMKINVEEEKYADHDTIGYDLAISYNDTDELTSTFVNQLNTSLKNEGYRVLLINSESASTLNNIYQNKVKYAIQIKYENTERAEWFLCSKVTAPSLNVYSITNQEKDFITQLGGKALGAGLCNQDSGNISCSLSNNKDKPGINSSILSIPTSFSTTQNDTLLEGITSYFTSLTDK